MKNKSKCNPYCDFTDSSLVATVKFSKMQNVLKNVSFQFRCYIIEADKTLRRKTNHVLHMRAFSLT